MGEQGRQLYYLLCKCQSILAVHAAVAAHSMTCIVYLLFVTLLQRCLVNSSAAIFGIVWHGVTLHGQESDTQSVSELECQGKATKQSV